MSPDSNNRRWSPRLHQALTLASVLGDLLIINLLIARFWLADARLVLGGVWPWALILSCLTWLALAWGFHLNPASRRMGRKVLSARISAATAILLFIILLGHIALNRNITLSPDFLYFSIALLILLVLWNLFIHSLARFLRSKGFDQRRVVIAGAGPCLPALEHYFQHERGSGYAFAGYLSDTPGGKGWLGGTGNLRQICSAMGVDELFLDLSALDASKRQCLMETAQDMHLQITLIPDIAGFISFRHIYLRLDQTPLMALGFSPLQLLPNRFIKRTLDLLVSFSGIMLVLSWLGPLIMLGIRLSSPGPVLFRQKRTGYYNRTFTMLKFRTMVDNTEADTHPAGKNDPRTTSIGRLLRRTSMDELPQLINVLAGQMS
ncbi:MAG TPA: sugar transferase, partial [Bacteroidales bacterium]|nr:sugar transferase [Bacteroidales bacterium]